MKRLLTILLLAASVYAADKPQKFKVVYAGGDVPGMKIGRGEVIVHYITLWLDGDRLKLQAKSGFVVDIPVSAVTAIKSDAAIRQAAGHTPIQGTDYVGLDWEVDGQKHGMTIQAFHPKTK